MNEIYQQALNLLKYAEQEYGLIIEHDKPFDIDGYWSHWPCKLDESKWPKGIWSQGPKKISIDYRGPVVYFTLVGKLIYVELQNESKNQTKITNRKVFYD